MQPYIHSTSLPPYPAPPSPTPSVAAYKQHAIQANDQAEGTEQARPATARYGRQISDIAKIISEE